MEITFNALVKYAHSPSLYFQIYGFNPLEDGEVDASRGRRFTKCLRKEEKDEYSRKQKVCDLFLNDFVGQHEINISVHMYGLLRIIL